MPHEVKPCPAAHCTGQIYVGEYESTIRVPAQDDDGFPLIDPDGTVVTVRLKLPRHVSRFTSEFRPGTPPDEALATWMASVREGLDHPVDATAKTRRARAGLAVETP